MAGQPNAGGTRSDQGQKFEMCTKYWAIQYMFKTTPNKLS